MFELLVSVVLNVPAGGATTGGVVDDEDDVVSDDVDCAKAPPATKISPHVATARYFFMNSLHNLNSLGAVGTCRISRFISMFQLLFSIISYVS